jgi:hypothetical protein
VTCLAATVVLEIGPSTDEKGPMASAAGPIHLVSEGRHGTYAHSFRWVVERSRPAEYRAGNVAQHDLTHVAVPWATMLR